MKKKFNFFILISFILIVNSIIVLKYLKEFKNGYCKIKNEEDNQEISSEKIDKKLKDPNSLINDLEPLSSEKKNNGILINGGVNSLDEEEEKKKLNILKKQIKETKEENDDKINNYEVEDTEINNKEKKEEIVIEPIIQNIIHHMKKQWII